MNTSSSDSLAEKDEPSTPPPASPTETPSIIVTPASKPRTADNATPARTISSDGHVGNINDDGDDEAGLELVRMLFQSPDKKHPGNGQRNWSQEAISEHGEENGQSRSDNDQSRSDNDQSRSDNDQDDDPHNISHHYPLSSFSQSMLLQSASNSPIVHNSMSDTPVKSSHLFSVFHTSPSQKSSTSNSDTTVNSTSRHGSYSYLSSSPVTETDSTGRRMAQNTTTRSSISSTRNSGRFSHSDQMSEDVDAEGEDINFYTETVRRTLERKERTILDLQSQLTLLQQDRELETEKYRREMVLMRDQMAKREEDMSQMRKQLLQLQHEHEIQIEKLKREHTEVLTEEQRSGSERATTLRDRIAKMNEEMELQKIRDKQQQSDIQRQQKKIERMREEHNNEIEELQHSHSQKLESCQERHAENLAETTRRIQRESAQSTREQLETLRTESYQQQQKIESEHRAQVSKLEESIHELQMRMSVIPELERQVNQYTLLKQEHSSVKQKLHALTQHSQQLEQQVHHSHEQGEQMEEMTRHMAQHNSVLQQQLDSARQHAAQMEERTRNMELLESELSHMKNVVLPEHQSRCETLQQKQTEQQTSTTEKFSRLSRDLHTILSMVMTAVSASNFNEEDMNEDGFNTDNVNASMISLNESALFDLGAAPLMHFDPEGEDSDNEGDDDDYDDGNGNGNGSYNKQQSVSGGNTSLVNQLYQQSRSLVSDLSSLRRRYQSLSSDLDLCEREKINADSIAQTLQEQLIEERRQSSDYQRMILHHEDRESQLQQEVAKLTLESQNSHSSLQNQHSQMQKLHSLVVRLLKASSPSSRDEDEALSTIESTEDNSGSSEYDMFVRTVTSLVQHHHTRYQENLHSASELETKLHNIQDQLFTTRQQLQSAWEDMESQRAEKERQRIEGLDQQQQRHEQQMDAVIGQHTEKYQKVDQRYRELQTNARDLSTRHMKLSMTNDLLEREVKELSDERHSLFNGIRLLIRGIRPMRQHIQDLRVQKQMLSGMLHRSQEKLNQLHQTIEKYCSRVLSKDGNTSSDSNITSASSHRTLSLRVVVIAVIAHHRMLRFTRTTSGEARRPSTISMHHGQERIQLLSLKHDAIMQKHMQHDTVQMNLLSDEVVNSDNPHIVVPCFLKLCTLFDLRTTQQIIMGASSGTTVESADNSGLNGLSSGTSGSLMLHALRQGLQGMRRAITRSERGDKASIDTEDPTRQARHRLRAWRQYSTDLQHRQTQLQRRENDMQRDMDRITSNNTDAARLLERRGQLVEYMEDRIRTLEADSVRTVPTEKYSKLETELNEAKRHTESMERDLSDVKRRADKWLTELEEARSKIRRQQRRMTELEQELKDSREIEFAQITAQLRRERERTLELKQENKKYQYLVQDMQSRLYLEKSADDSTMTQDDAESVSFEKRRIHEPKSAVSSPSTMLMQSHKKKPSDKARASDMLVEEIERDIEMARAELLDLKGHQTDN